ncbi:MAG: hypothetical protein IT233_10590 [Bacteroidia bacterium]|nr:hypothetical protein [Bacteroidia bacterium]
MQKFNYTITIEAPSREIAEMLMEHICKENIELLELLSRKYGQEKIKEPEFPKHDPKENLVKGFRQFEKVMGIIEKCVTDETNIDVIAELLGVNVKPKTAKQ